MPKLTPSRRDFLRITHEASGVTVFHTGRRFAKYAVENQLNNKISEINFGWFVREGLLDEASASHSHGTFYKTTEKTVNILKGGRP
jgi:hypothetical protein